MSASKKLVARCLKIGLAAGLGLGLLAPQDVGAQWRFTGKKAEESRVAPDAPDRYRPKPTRPGNDRTLTKAETQGIAYLVNQQHRDGGWGQGGGWRQAARGGRVQGHAAQERSDVGNTAIAAMALIRAGHTPVKGEYKDNVRRGIEFICQKVEASDANSLSITDIKDTQIQMKIGRYVDTFLTASVLPEVMGEMPTRAGQAQLESCLNKVVSKIEKNQQEDGTYAGNQGWAAVLSQGLANRGLNRARQKGAKVSERALARAQAQASASFDRGSGSFKKPASGPSDAGVGIYGASSSLAGLSDSIATAEAEEDDARDVLRDPKAPAKDKREAQRKLDRLDEAREMRAEAKKSLVNQLGDARYVSGFGSNGGEEFLSYLNISESLRTEGGKEWRDWNTKMAQNLGRVQNGDGSWSGHHCITGRTFVTSTALLVLMADRASDEVAGKIRRG